MLLVVLLDVDVFESFRAGRSMCIPALSERRHCVASPSRAASLTAVRGKQDMQKAVDKLPRGTEMCVVEGGNNSGFASYSRQPLDWEVREDS